MNQTHQIHIPCYPSPRGAERAQHYGYTPFGDERYTNNPHAFSVTNRYTGQSLDEEIGLYYYGARYYDAELARFIQADTIVPEPGFSQAFNRYAYVYNNPIKFTDPTGQWVHIAFAAAFAAVHTAAHGGDLGDVVKAAVTAAVTAAITGEVASGVTAATGSKVVGAVAGFATGYAIGGAMTGNWNFTVMDGVNLAIAVMVAVNSVSKTDVGPGGVTDAELQHGSETSRNFFESDPSPPGWFQGTDGEWHHIGEYLKPDSTSAEVSLSLAGSPEPSMFAGTDIPDGQYMIWTGERGKFGWHSYIGIGDPNGDWNAYGYRLKYPWGQNYNNPLAADFRVGQVYRDVNVLGKIQRSMWVSKANAEIARQSMERIVGAEAFYDGLLCNCHHFSNTMFNEFRGSFPNLKPKPAIKVSLPKRGSPGRMY